MECMSCGCVFESCWVEGFCCPTQLAPHCLHLSDGLHPSDAPAGMQLMSVAGGMEGSVLHVCRRMVASGGMEALYRGFKATLLGDVMGNALGFTFYEMGNRCALISDKQPGE